MKILLLILAGLAVIGLAALLAWDFFDPDYDDPTGDGEP